MKKLLVVGLSSVLFSSFVFADGGYYEGWTDEQLATLKDPTTRNEDISNTVVEVGISQMGDGNFLYNYTVTNPETNLGTVMSFAIDVSCDHPSSDPLGYNVMKSISDDGKHLLLGDSHPDYPDSYKALISVSNKVGWPLFIAPTQSKSGNILISAETPVERTFRLKPLWDNYGWDYREYNEDDPNQNWPDSTDFVVTGTVLGPRCTTDESPIPPYTDAGTGTDGGSNGGNGGNGGTDCSPGNNGQGNAYGLDKGKGHTSSNGNHNGHDHDCE